MIVRGSVYGKPETTELMLFDIKSGDKLTVPENYTVCMLFLKKRECIRGERMCE